MYFLLQGRIYSRLLQQEKDYYSRVEIEFNSKYKKEKWGMRTLRVRDGEFDHILRVGDSH